MTTRKFHEPKSLPLEALARVAGGAGVRDLIDAGARLAEAIQGGRARDEAGQYAPVIDYSGRMEREMNAQYSSEMEWQSYLQDQSPGSPNSMIDQSNEAMQAIHSGITFPEGGGMNDFGGGGMNDFGGGGMNDFGGGGMNDFGGGGMSDFGGGGMGDLGGGGMGDSGGGESF